MKSKLTNNLDKDEQSRIEQEFKQSFYFRRHVREVLQKDIDSLHRRLRNDILDDPNWQVKHPAILGEINALIKLKSYLE